MKNVNFAQTFKPEKQYISAILKLATKNEPMTAKQISLETGIPSGESSGKVVPHIEYAKYMGLIDYVARKSYASSVACNACSQNRRSADLGRNVRFRISKVSWKYQR